MTARWLPATLVLLALLAQGSAAAHARTRDSLGHHFLSFRSSPSTAAEDANSSDLSITHSRKMMATCANKAWGSCGTGQCCPAGANNNCACRNGLLQCGDSRICMKLCPLTQGGCSPSANGGLGCACPSSARYCNPTTYTCQRLCPSFGDCGSGCTCPSGQTCDKSAGGTGTWGDYSKHVCKPSTPTKCVLNGACGQPGGFCTCQGGQSCDSATNTCKYPDCAIGADSGICSSAPGLTKTCECVGTGVKCDATTSYMCYPDTIVNSQKVCYTDGAPATCGTVVAPPAKAQCSCLTGCRAGGKCPPCLRDSTATIFDPGCNPDKPWCQADGSNFMNNKCVACLADGTGCDAGNRCDTSGATPVCKPICDGTTTICNAANTNCLCPTSAPFCNTSQNPNQCTTQCANGVKDGAETDVDCGGSNTCPRCADGKTCSVNADCQSNICTAAKKCASAPGAPGLTSVGPATATTPAQVPAVYTAPASNGGSPIDYYLVVVVPTGTAPNPNTSPSVRYNGAVPPAAGTDIKGLVTNGQSYDIYVYAHNAIGFSGPSSKVTWIADLTPFCNNGAKDSSETDADCGGICAGAPTSKQCGVGKGCSINVDCSSGNCLSNQCADKPDPPTNLGSTVTASQVKITFTPGAANGSPITSYTVLVVPPGATPNKATSPSTPGSPAGTNVASLLTGLQSDVYVFATNAIGDSALSAKYQLDLTAACSNGVPNTALETDLDCGGICSAVKKCDLNQACSVGSDCSSSQCAGSKCVQCTPGTAATACNDGNPNSVDTCVNNQCVNTFPTCTPALTGGQVCDSQGGTKACSCAGPNVCDASTNYRCQLPACTLGNWAGICAAGAPSAPTCRCTAADTKCDSTTSYSCQSTITPNSQTQCYTDNAPTQCGSDANTQCLCLLGGPGTDYCQDGKCQMCKRSGWAKDAGTADAGCPPDKPACLVDAADRFNNKCVACLADGTGCDSGYRCDTSGAAPVCKPDCTGTGILVCNASNSACFCPSGTPFCVSGVCKSQCANGAQDGGETDVDCGGNNSCPRCTDGKTCSADTDCQGNVCTAAKKCASAPGAPGLTSVGPATSATPARVPAVYTAPASNGGSSIDYYLVVVVPTGTAPNPNTSPSVQFNGAVPPGGGSDIKGLVTHGQTYDIYVYAHNAAGFSDPSSKVTWTANLTPFCNNGAKDSTETDTDCGGICAAAPNPNKKCSNGLRCSTDSDCQSGHCVAGTCVACTSNADCNDNNSNTVDTCTPSNTCLNQLICGSSGAPTTCGSSAGTCVVTAAGQVCNTGVIQKKCGSSGAPTTCGATAATCYCSGCQTSGANAGMCAIRPFTTEFRPNNNPSITGDAQANMVSSSGATSGWYYISYSMCAGEDLPGYVAIRAGTYGGSSVTQTGQWLTNKNNADNGNGGKVRWSDWDGKNSCWLPSTPVQAACQTAAGGPYYNLKSAREDDAASPWLVVDTVASMEGLISAVMNDPDLQQTDYCWRLP